VLAGGYTTAPFPDVPSAMAVENGLPSDYYKYLSTGGTGLPHGAVDTRVPNATTLPPGPFQLTSKTLPYDSYTNSRCTVSTRCGSRLIAIRPTLPGGTRADARVTCFPG